ncbi:ethanolamine corrinoid cobalamin adenosyltransferase [Brevibacillus laterosporus]|uniref:ethanolamine corrinoid cobalamin adenosyltransferase n=1 Tax=Brevibacillus laterosporus TaxID=1465 RepID=UPI0003600AF6|nr:ethanolamine corrinoid cobalamin adenosyltransferase [Brevibacillus laterosporus]ATO51799.1 cobalamin adenosyltransferase [Brevibacillus laterosporus DSM 25]AYB37884.1 cobalamin adenosyltransferase [Brevibacillus laterosporus]MBG9774846.1 ethanolamine utilization cobalamin adenosyltransferase [Brevibacillus laterosporus]MBG9798792.1 ethanolamine utilization cobalamin adenosyltransferase [Brevibacillus laterosporus]MBG9802213.1 ethanolamine utilization cobalamin adenosyltransferase [Brevibac
MALITESDLRKHFKNQDAKDTKIYEVKKGVILTPSAKSFLTDHQIELRYFDENATQQQSAHVPTPELSTKPSIRYETIYGGYLESKPEHMTHLYGNLLVYKDHPRIIFRGKLDSLEAKILQAQITGVKAGLPKLAADLEEVLLFVRNILRCEVLGERLSNIQLLDMTSDEIREQSHHPKKYFGLDHFKPSYEMGEMVVALNSLRTFTRETELLAYQAFKQEHGSVEREDIIQALNRLSSLFWILMFRVRIDKYKA